MNELDELRGHGRMTWIEAEQGWVAARTGAVASAIWVNRLLGPPALVFITMDGESFRGDTLISGSDSRREDGGEA